MAKRLSEDASVPLYQQAKIQIKRAIEDGTYAPGDRIPPELELRRAYAMGLGTVRHAVEELVAEGYLTKQQGRGTFVNAPGPGRKVLQESDLQSFTRACEASGMEPGARRASRRFMPADGPLAGLLGVDPGAELLVVTRVRTADGVPVKLEHGYFARADFSFLESRSLAGASILATVLERTGRSPSRADPCTLEVVRADAEVADRLRVPMGEPMFFMDARLLDEEGSPLLVCRQYMVGSRYMFNY